MKSRTLFLILIVAAPLRAQEVFTLDWSSISAGGLTADAGPGEFTIEATIGQLGAAEPAAAPVGEFSISGGYWSFTLNEPLDLGLAMQINGDAVTLTWDTSVSIAVQLQSSADLWLWEPVSPQPQQPPFIESAGQRRYYRITPAP